MSRLNWIKVHLVLTGLFLPFLFFMPLSGGLYLLGEKGQIEKQQAFVVEGQLPEGKKERSQYIKKIFADQSIDFDFEYIKESGNTLILRPSTRDHYSIKVSEGQLAFTLLKPDLLKVLVEMHKGHGPGKFKKLETLFALGLLLVAISGLVLAFTLKMHRSLLLKSSAAGALVFALMLWL